ncbi:MFS general substrate transporter [Cylindrobasidium torrendii FP15055 ss-10]|uniref:MFS general substrate transporter n=1 Tax=Cylindrobasidium torrendii FP15055 ss-10 TaxID=1314674 RepID=A0A0D7BS24_9AGAR|nr:MFS general substrate transporter [Cylindrobasidium torrendii FP15055 ss-10]
MVYDLLRDSSFGFLVNWASRGRIFSFPEERADFVSPRVNADEVHGTASAATLPQNPEAQVCAEPEMEYKAHVGQDDGTLVTWYGDDDPDNPLNWSPKKRGFVTFLICFLNFSSYTGSAIYTAAIPSIMESFDVSLTYATLGLTLYVLGYGIGPMFLSPFQEIARLGRNTVYLTTLFLFVLFQIPVFCAPNIQTLMAFRFLTGFLSSPALSTGGATMGDIFHPEHLGYFIGLWAIGGVAGPVTGPIVGGFAAQANGWKWPIYELTWLTSFTFLILFALLPETYGPTILYRRAQRLRKLTGNQRLYAQVERDAESKSIVAALNETLLRPFVLLTEPMLFFVDLYTGFIYSVFYLWFEAFPLVFNDIYHFNLGVSGLPYLGFIVSSFFTYAIFWANEKYFIKRRYAQAAASGKPPPPPEIRIWLGILSGISIPTSVLIFGFASKPDIHWIVPVIGAALYLPGLLLSVMTLSMYISLSYPKHLASVLAGNTVFRGGMASVFPLFGRAFFVNLGLGPASAILAGISFFLMCILWLLMKYGPRLRKRSKYATYESY